MWCQWVIYIYICTCIYLSKNRCYNWVVFSPAWLFEGTWYNFDTIFSFKFSIGTIYVWSIGVLKKLTVSLIVFCFGLMVLFIESYWQNSDLKKDRYNDDLRGTRNFRTFSWMFPLGFIEDKLLVHCGDLPNACSSIYGMILDFSCSEDE